MKTKLLIALCLASSIGFAQNSKKHVVHFNSDSYAISSPEAAKLKNFLRSITTEIDSITLSGHTDHDASEKYNITLSDNRCKEVKHIFQNTFNVSAKTAIKTFGETKPISSNTSLNGKANNRRVEVEVYLSEAEKKQSFFPPNENYYYDEWDKEGQTFRINPKINNTLKGNEGTLIIIPKDAICNSQNLKYVDITLKEYLTMSDILMAQLTTTSDDKIIETNGMVEIRAYSDTDRLKLCNKIAVMFPIEKNKSTEGYMGFDGEHDPHSGLVNWKPSIATSLNYLNTDLLDGNGSLNRTFFGSNCMQGFIPIRCDKDCKSKVLQSEGRSYYRKQYKSDEVVKRLRKRYWFRTKVSSDIYYNRYLKIRSKMNDSMSAAGLLPCRTRYANTDELKKYLNNLEKGGEIDLSLTDMSVNYIITETQNLGMINCDRFTNYPNVQDVKYSVGNAVGAISSRLIFHKQKAILPGHQTLDKKINFNKVPLGEMVTLIVIKFFKEKIFIASPKYKLGQTPDLAFEEVKKENLESKIKRIVQH